MRVLFFVSLLSFVSACARTQDGHEFGPPIDLSTCCGLGVMYVEGKRDTECLKGQVELARRVLNMSWSGSTVGGSVFRVGPYIDPTFDMSDATIYVYAGDQVGDELNASLGKYDHRDRSVHVSLNMGSLVHELLHYYEIEVLGTSEQDAIDHKFWDERGFYYASNYYRDLVIPALGGKGCD
jgi:hypothetical protein